MILGLLKHKRWSTVDHSPWVLYRRAHIIFDFWLRDIRVWKLITFNPIWWDLEVWTFIAHYVSASNWAKVIVRLRKHILNFESEPLMWRNLKPMFKFQCFLTRPGVRRTAHKLWCPAVNKPGSVFWQQLVFSGRPSTSRTRPRTGTSEDEDV